MNQAQEQDKTTSAADLAAASEDLNNAVQQHQNSHAERYQRAYGEKEGLLTRLVGYLTLNRNSRTTNDGDDVVVGASRLARMRRSKQNALHEHEALDGATYRLLDNGEVHFTDTNGNKITGGRVDLLWEERGLQLRSWLAWEANKINRETETLTHIHSDAPPPDTLPEFLSEPFPEPAPDMPRHAPLPQEPLREVAEMPNHMAGLIGGRRKIYERRQRDLDEQHASARQEWKRATAEALSQKTALSEQFQREYRDWELRKHAHDEEQKNLVNNRFHQLFNDEQLMAQTLERSLEQLKWPQPIQVNYALQREGKLLSLDIALPTKNAMPRLEAAMGPSGRALAITSEDDEELFLDYARYVHGIILRTVCVAFASLPKLDHVLASGYLTPSDDSDAGKSYIISTLAERDVISMMNFDELDTLNPIAALEQFKLRRKVTEPWNFRTIEPFNI